MSRNKVVFATEGIVSLRRSIYEAIKSIEAPIRTPSSSAYTTSQHPCCPLKVRIHCRVAINVDQKPFDDERVRKA